MKMEIDDGDDGDGCKLDVKKNPVKAGTVLFYAFHPHA